MGVLPLQKNTVALTTLAMLAALGIVVRIFVRIPIATDVELTPGFLFSLLGGIIGGVPGGVTVGAIVGLGGALAGGEFPLIPMLGNICLGLGTGIAIHISRDRDSILYRIVVVLGGGLIGGFIPDLTIFYFLFESFELAVFNAILDMSQAFLWAIVALLVERGIIRPLIGHYLYAEEGPLELEQGTITNAD
jgi:hypothetical protein